MIILTRPLRQVYGGYPEKLGISWDELVGMGRQNPDDHGERFCMSTFACNTCQEVNGVSKLHGWPNVKMFALLWKGYFPEEKPRWLCDQWCTLPNMGSYRVASYL